MSLEDLNKLETESKSLADELAQAAPGAAAVDGAVEPGQVVNFGDNAKAMVDLFVGLLTGYAPDTLDIWTDETKARVAASLAPVMEKYNFNVGNLPPELTLLIMAGPPLYQSARIIAEQMRKDRLPKKPANESSVTDQAPDDPHNPGTHSQMALYPNG